MNTQESDRLRKWILAGFNYYNVNTHEVSDTPPTDEELIKDTWVYLPDVLKSIKKSGEMQ